VWTTTLQPYVKNWKLWACPSCPLNTSLLPAPLSPGAETIPISYTWNGQLGNVHLAAVQNVARCIMVWEGAGKQSFRNYTLVTPTYDPAFRRPPHPTYSAGVVPCVMYVPSIPTPSYWVHGRGANYLYVDGHVKWVTVSSDPQTSPWADVDDQGRAGGYWSATGQLGCAFLFRPTLQ
jgi:prepilin-type processing-associated H-X9-DG protein